MKLAKELKEKGILKSRNLCRAFSKIDRKDFVPEEMERHAYEDIPLSIGYGQTISQPSVVAFMLEKLSPKKAERILDIGCGSGWTTALLAEAVGKEGKVVGIEKIPELKSFGKENISKYNFIEEERVEMISGDGYEGFKESAPYDKILISAALSGKEDIPSTWREQLVEKGIIVLPIENYVYKLTKDEEDFLEEKYFGFVFVPLVKEK